MTNKRNTILKTAKSSVKSDLYAPRTVVNGPRKHDSDDLFDDDLDLDLDVDIAELDDDEFNPADLDLDTDIAEPGDEEDSERSESNEDRNVWFMNTKISDLSSFSVIMMMKHVRNSAAGEKMQKTENLSEKKWFLSIIEML